VPAQPHFIRHGSLRVGDIAAEVARDIDEDINSEPAVSVRIEVAPTCELPLATSPSGTVPPRATAPAHRERLPADRSGSRADSESRRRSAHDLRPWSSRLCAEGARDHPLNVGNGQIIRAEHIPIRHDVEIVNADHPLRVALDVPATDRSTRSISRAVAPSAPSCPNTLTPTGFDAVASISMRARIGMVQALRRQELQRLVQLRL